MLNRYYMLIMLVLVPLLILTACTGGGETTTITTQITQPTTTTPKTTQQKPTSTTTTTQPTTTATPTSTTVTETPTKTTDITAITTDSWYQGIVDAVKALQPTTIPKHLKVYSCNKTGVEFDINTYFTVLTHLSIEEGYVLDYVYLYDFMGGRPIIYVRQESQEPYKNFEEYYKYAEELKIENDYDFVSLLMYGEAGAFENKIRIDGTKEGFFEYVVLQMLGGQFYLWWHANYDDAIIICDPKRIDYVKKEIDSWGVLDLSPEIIQQARSLDYQPIVELTDSIVNVSLIYFTKWGGFIRVTFTINREYPHTIIGVNSELLIQYNCGMMF